MQAYQLTAGQSFKSLTRIDLPAPTPGPNEVQVRVKAVSLNFRDLMIADGLYPVGSDAPVIPCSDGAGEVIAIGAGVTRFQVGDVVAGSFFPDWIGGEQTPAAVARSLGANMPGMLAEEVVLPESALVRAPAHMSAREAATLPCAALTAWRSMFEVGQLKPGQRVLLLGTGGVSIWALQMAHAAGLEAIITSSSDAKLAQARALGAAATINYRDTPEWQDEVLKLTGGNGVDLVVEVGGQGTLRRSINSTCMGGMTVIIGGVSGFGGDFDPLGVILGARRMSGVFVGSRQMFEDMNRFLEISGLRPVIDRGFAFDDAAQAYEHLANGRHFGKVVIDVNA
ncbi:NAD(P)-dependent alcohol dehydrogenase [Nitrogeniibacter mangrovi]|uniref:NAD(P)-dependent alcohol dehydrogenase n=1 Tax=Nitrogeniibacter mangrovi TaxID=2016596 RepID=A0A6C1B6F0_9RHOO|nr:NAD(P)-dependent alcohol dehydrogenase [Nitrogeniibacter mangrovi]QID19027.1 NAD(P)-dependent alcohol dehydrogenase [Nitrogeniibacter mangrovi]